MSRVSVRGAYLAWSFAIAAVILVCAGTVAAASRPARFDGLGTLPGGRNTFASKAADMTPDGAVVVGSSASANSGRLNEAFRWDRENGMMGLGALPGPGFFSNAFAVSDDGNTIVGQAANSGGNAPAAFIWDPISGMQDIGHLPGAGNQASAYGVSGDGKFVVGVSNSDRGNEAFIWDSEDGMVGLGGLPRTGLYIAEALGVSRDGSVVVGSSRTDSNVRAFRWHASTGMVDIVVTIPACGNGFELAALLPGLLRLDRKRRPGLVRIG